MDYLEEAKKQIDFVEVQTSEEYYMKYGPVAAQLATACAQVAQAELLAAQTELLVALIERLDALTDDDGGRLCVTTTRTR